MKKMVALNSISLPADKRLLVAEFKQAMQELYGERLFQVILYGWYARGDYHADLDIDFMVILNDSKIKTSSEITSITRRVYEMILRHEIDISYRPVARSRFETTGNPLFYFVKKEGVLA